MPNLSDPKPETRAAAVKQMPAQEQPIPEAAVGQERFIPIAEQIARGMRKRIPLSTAIRRMEVQPIPGYYLYWFKDSNVPAALDAGYEFCQKDDAYVNQLGLANDKMASGSTDLGTRVSIIGSLTSGPDGGAERAYLMKLRQEWRDEDRKAIDDRNANILSYIFKGEKIVAPDGTLRDKGIHEYVRTALFNRPVRKAQIGNR